MRAERAALHLRVEQFLRGDLRALLGDLQQARVDQLALLRRDGIHQHRRAREPVRAEDGIGILESRALLFNRGAEIAKDVHRLAHDVGDLGIDLGIAEIRRVGDAKVGDALVEAEAPVAPLAGQRLPVPRIG